ncbi:MAG: alpha-2-macroglobulin [Spirochaetales bacterium]|nr:alpha-2-macroglobulin [Spirochaetales bacterium]
MTRRFFQCCTGLVFLVAVATLLSLTTCQSDQRSIIDPELRGSESLPESAGMAISPHPDYSSDTVNYFQLDAFDVSMFSLSESSEPLAIVDFGPRDELPVEIKRPSVTIVFSQPMVPLARLGEPAVDSPIMSVDPPLDGHFRWYGSRVLAFEPDSDLVAQREFTVTVDTRAISLGGKELGEDFTFTFRTEYLDIAGFFPGAPEVSEYVDPRDVPLEAARSVTISFTYPVDIDHVSHFLHVRTATDELPFIARRPDNTESLFDPVFVDRTVVLELTETPPSDSDVTVVLLEGAASEAGFLGRPDPVERSYHTLRPFRFIDYSTYSWSFPQSDQADANPLYVEFSHPIEPQDVHRFLSVGLPDVDLSDNVEVWGNTVKINNLPVEYESEYWLRIEGELPDIYGRTLGTTRIVEIAVPAAASYSHFPNTGTRMLESQFPPKIIWEYQNIFDGVWKIDQIADPYRSFEAAQLAPYDFSDALENTKQYEVLDLDPWLNDSGFGWVGLSWNFSEPNSTGVRSSWRQENLQLQVTDLGITVRYAYNRILVWVHSLSTNEPVSGAAVHLLREDRFIAAETGPLGGTTDNDGFLRIDLAPGEYEEHFRDDRNDRIRFAVRNGEDRAVFRPNGTHNAYAFGVYHTVKPILVEQPRMQAFIFTDRGLYRPGESVTFRGIDRTWSAGSYSVFRGSYTLQVREQTYQSEPFLTQRGRTSASGGFYGSFALPDDLAPGSYAIEYDRDGARQTIAFQVANFRRASFQVNVTQPDREYFLGDQLSFPLEATYLAGGGLSRAGYDYSWAKIPTRYTPPGPGWDAFAFGPSGYGYRQTLSSGRGTLSPLGDATAQQQSTSEGIQGKPYRYELEVRVEDVDRQEIAGRAAALVHPAGFYIGATLSDDTAGYWTRFLPSGQRAELRYAFVRPDGSVMDGDGVGDAQISLIKHTWMIAQQRGVYGRINTRYELVDEVLIEEELQIGESERDAVQAWEFLPETAGRYTLRLTALDGAGRTAVTEVSFYATGASWIRWGGDNAEEITLVPDRDLYEVGDTARLMVQSPLPEGRYLITTEREGIFDERIVELDGSANLIEVPITDDHIPVVYVAVTSFTARTAPPTDYFEPDLGKPLGYFGITALTVSPAPRTLDVEITPAADVYGPGDEAEVTVRVTRNGRPVAGAEVTFLAVDRGVLDLINYHVPDPIDFFYAPYKFPLGVLGADSRSLLIDPVTYEIKNLQGGDADEGKLQRREDFTPLAVFEPFAETDESGTAVISFTLPDTLTTYRTTAVIVDENRFGIAERELLVQNPINVRTALPRVLRLRDTSRSGVIVTNIGSEPVDVSVSLDVTGLVIEGSSSRSVTVDGNESLEVPFTIVATEKGSAELVFTVRSEVLSEELVAQLEVVQPRVTEAFTVTGRTDRDPDDLGRAAGTSPAPDQPGEVAETGTVVPPGTATGVADTATASQVPAAAEEGVIIPTTRLPGFGALEVSLNSTRLAQVNEAIRYLAEYPFDYLDNQLTRVLPQIVFGTTLQELSSGAVAYQDGRVENFFSELVTNQNDDGGFSYNPRYYAHSSPYVSVKVAHYFALALANGFEIGRTIDVFALIRYLTAIQSDQYLADYVKLYGLYVQSLLGSNVISQLDSFRERGDEIGLSGYGFLGLAYSELGRHERAEEMLSRIRQFIRIGTRGLDITEPYESRFYFDSQVGQLALTQLLYLELLPSDEMNERLAHTLQLRQRLGHWVNTADTAWAVIAYGGLIAAESGVATDMDVTVSLDGTPILQTGFSGIAALPVVEEFPFDETPLSAFNRNALLPLLIRKEGRGIAYYSATMRYALPSEVVLPRDEGIGVFARIEDLDGVPVAGTTLELGKTYRYRVTLSTSRNRQMVALRVPVPSGVDILDASFVTTGRYGEAGGVNQRSWTRETVYGETDEYVAEGTVRFSPFGVDWNFYRPVQRIMDNEVRYFFDEFYPGHQEVTFLFRTTTPGIYPTPPASALCMYEEEVFGRAGGALFVIAE